MAAPAAPHFAEGFWGDIWAEGVWADESTPPAESEDIEYVQSTQVGTAAVGVTELTTANFAASVTSGNLIIVNIRTGSDVDQDVTGVTDTVGTTYTLRGTSTASDGTTMRQYSGVAGMTGTNAVTVTWESSGTFRWVHASEFSPGIELWSDPFDAVDEAAGTGVTDLVGDGITTTSAKAVLVLGVSQGALTTFTVGADFTLDDGTIGSGASNFGGVQYRILSTTLTGYVSHITASATNDYAMVVGAYITAPYTPPASDGDEFRRRPGRAIWRKIFLKDRL